ncbi:MAG: twin-arginine translocase TatA/TatE family subunit [Bacteroidota bacterium]
MKDIGTLVDNTCGHQIIEEQMGNIGAPEIILIVLAVLLLFGAKRLPELAKGIGKGIKDFKKEINSVTDSISTNNPNKQNNQ